jgi:hypothetical protein
VVAELADPVVMAVLVVLAATLLLIFMPVQVAGAEQVTLLPAVLVHLD